MKVAIMGTGRMAGNMAATLKELNHEDIVLEAAASRTLKKAREFTKLYDIPKACGSYDKVLKDPDIDLVYIATPNLCHFENAKAAILAKKHVLLEKSFTLNKAQAVELFELAKKNKVLITEAMWIRYQPSRQLIGDIISKDIIGKVHTVQANLCYPKAERLDFKLGGGALLDLGVYTLNFAMMILGDNVREIHGTCIRDDSGMDVGCNIILNYDNGSSASLLAGTLTPSDRSGCIYGEKGYLLVDNINNPCRIKRYDRDHYLCAAYEVPRQITGYEYQVTECLETIKKGELECPSMPHDITLKVMDLMDKLRQDWGITYPGEKAS